MARGALVLVEDGTLALIRRVVPPAGAELHCYLFPGGQADEGETPDDAAVREARDVRSRALAALLPAGVPPAHTPMLPVQN